MILVRDPASAVVANEGALREIFNLTEAEARLASALAKGHSIDSAAAFLLIRPATARSQLKAVFRKIGVCRQQDLVRLLTSLSTMSAQA